MLGYQGLHCDELSSYRHFPWCGKHRDDIGAGAEQWKLQKKISRTCL